MVRYNGALPSRLGLELGQILEMVVGILSFEKLFFLRLLVVGGDMRVRLLLTATTLAFRTICGALFALGEKT